MLLLVWSSSGLYWPVFGWWRQESLSTQPLSGSSGTPRLALPGSRNRKHHRTAPDTHALNRRAVFAALH